MARFADNLGMKPVAIGLLLFLPLLTGCGPTPPDSQQADLGVGTVEGRLGRDAEARRRHEQDALGKVTGVG